MVIPSQLAGDIRKYMTEHRAPVVLKRAPTVDLNLPAEEGYKTYKLAFDFKAISLVKAQTGKSLLNSNIWSTIEDDPDLLIAIIWAGLQLHHPEVSLDEVAHMLLPPEMPAYLMAVIEAWNKVRPKADAEDPKKEPTTRAVAVLQKT